MNEIWELDWVLNEEYWCVVTDHIVVALFGVMLYSKSTWITVTIVGSTLTSNSGEAEEDWGLFADLVQELGLG